MKKNKLLLLVISVLITSSSFSQNEKKFGIHIGTNISNFRGNEIIENSKSKVGFLIGISHEYYLNKNLSLKPIFNFERKSISNELVPFGLTGIFDKREVKTNYDYLTLPILLKYRFGNSNFFLNAGPFIGYLLNAKSAGKSGFTQDSTSLNKKLDAGLSMGIGIKFRLDDKNDLNIEMRNNLGLINTSAVDVINNGSIKSNSWSFVLNWDSI